MDITVELDLVVSIGPVVDSLTLHSSSAIEVISTVQDSSIDKMRN